LQHVSLRGLLALIRSRLQRGVLTAVFVVACLACSAYVVFAKGLGDHPTLVLAILYQVLVFGCYGALWLLMEQVFCKDQPSPSQAFWHLVVAAAVASAIFVAVVTIIPGGFNDDGEPLAISTVAQSALIAPAFFGFAVLLLLRFRELLLHRRTRAAIRSWRLMLIALIVNAGASGLFGVFPESVLNEPVRIITGLVLLVFIAINVFRVSWVVRLSAGRKGLTILMALLVMLFSALLIVSPSNDLQAVDAFGFGFGVPAAFLSTYNAGLHAFAVGAGRFGIIYCLTSILSLLFHLPTTSDYRRREGEMAAIYSLTDLVKEVFDLDKLVRTIVSSSVNAHSATSAWLTVPDPESGLLRPQVVAAHNIQRSVVESKVNSEALYDDAASAQETLYLKYARSDHRVRARPGDSIESLLIVPLAAHQSVLGVLFVAKDIARGFNGEDIQSINAFAAQAALALDNARLFERQIERERLARELAIARDVQQRLLPQRLPTCPHLDIAVLSAPAQEVGGDYYDFVQLDDERLAFIVGDVSGKGTSAAFYMAGMQGVFRSLTRITPNPLEFLVRANRVLSESMERNVFISVIYGIVDRQKQQIALARAGHCPAILARRNEPAAFLRSQGPGIGLFRGADFPELVEVKSVSMVPGDIMVFYTDGLVESRNASGDEYGYKRLLASVERLRHEDAATIHKALLDDLQQFMGSSSRYDDDMTLLVFRWRKATQA